MARVIRDRRLHLRPPQVSLALSLQVNHRSQASLSLHQDRRYRKPYPALHPLLAAVLPVPLRKPLRKSLHKPFHKLLHKSLLKLVRKLSRTQFRKPLRKPLHRPLRKPLRNPLLPMDSDLLLWPEAVPVNWDWAPSRPLTLAAAAKLLGPPWPPHFLAVSRWASSSSHIMHWNEGYSSKNNVAEPNQEAFFSTSRAPSPPKGRDEKVADI
ncbi:hypothetical protein P8C59_000081 [Phyllachora maydis]|uniref:Uncharacterized protein n=1 Tax=Phyllachora maydis TaxID=1825666 RepID=A0AAD9HV49_9PEZI|nr:hypothetical protein P8C59_000081 [Phyllachora maydis]